MRTAPTMAVESCIDGRSTPVRRTARRVRVGGGESALVGTDFFDADASSVSSMSHCPLCMSIHDASKAHFKPATAHVVHRHDGPIRSPQAWRGNTPRTRRQRFPCGCRARITQANASLAAATRAASSAASWRPALARARSRPTEHSAVNRTKNETVFISLLRGDSAADCAAPDRVALSITPCPHASESTCS